MPKHDRSLLQVALIGFRHRLTEIDRAMEDVRRRIGGNHRQADGRVRGGGGWSIIRREWLEA